MHRVADVVAVMNRWAPLGWQYPWDRSGLAVGSPEQPVSKVLLCLSVTPEVCAMAHESGAELILSHHPLIWNPMKRLDPRDPKTAICMTLLRHNIAALSAHTNLDIAPRGVNHALAQALRLTVTGPLFQPEHLELYKLAIFVPESHLNTLRSAAAEAGAGIIGNYTECAFSVEGIGTYRPGDAANPYSGARGELSEEQERRLEILLPAARLADVLRATWAAHPYEEMAYDVYPLKNTPVDLGLGLVGELPEAATAGDFAAFAARALQVDHVRLVGSRDRHIKRIAVMGGSGGGEVNKIPDDIDCFVTGDLKYHDALDATHRDLIVIDAGHAATEKGIVPVMADYLKQHLPGIETMAYLEAELYQVIQPG